MSEVSRDSPEDTEGIPTRTRKRVVKIIPTRLPNRSMQSPNRIIPRTSPTKMELDRRLLILFVRAPGYLSISKLVNLSS